MGGTEYSLKILYTDKGKMVNICDRELIGKVFREKNIVLSISEDFYLGEMVDETEIINAMREADILSIVGEKSVQVAIENKIIHPDSVIYVEGVPYAIYISTL